MTRRRAAVVGCGLIGGSIGLALRDRGWHVTGDDHNSAAAARALELSALDAVGTDPEAEITFIATPVRAVAHAAAAALAAGPGVVTDVGSVKGSVVAAIDDPRFVGGHPMAGSELEGVDGSSEDLFEGAVWVLTPTAGTDDDAYALVRTTVASFGAEVVDLAPANHDELVAVVSHVPHLAAASLMRVADARAEEHRALLRLAAGGFRDMTRIASGHPGIWPDICHENRDAIVGGLDRLIAALEATREIVASGNHEQLVQDLERARQARVNLPARYTRPSLLAEIRIPVPDQPGVLLDVTTVATQLDINIVDLEIAHSAEGAQGVLIVLVEADAADSLVAALHDRSYRPSVRRLR